MYLSEKINNYSSILILYAIYTYINKKEIKNQNYLIKYVIIKYKI